MLRRFGNFGYRPFEKAGAAKASSTIRKMLRPVAILVELRSLQILLCIFRTSKLSKVSNTSSMQSFIAVQYTTFEREWFLLMPYERHCWSRYDLRDDSECRSDWTANVGKQTEVMSTSN